MLHVAGIPHDDLARRVAILVLGGIAGFVTCAALAQERLSLQIKPSETPAPRVAGSPALDLTLRWPPVHGRSSMALVAGRPLLAPYPRANTLDALNTDPDARSPSELMFVGVEFDSGARLRVRKWGDGLKINYRTRF